MTQANLSETLFKPRFKHPETSTLVRRFSHGAQPPVQSALDGKTIPHWYRMINRLMWIWRGIDPVKSSTSGAYCDERCRTYRR